MHWNSGFYKPSQYYNLHTNEECDIHLQGEECRYSKCRDIQGQTGTDKNTQGETERDKDRQGQTETDMARRGHTGKDRNGQE